jgi:SAM-dependent methyltransferase
MHSAAERTSHRLGLLDRSAPDYLANHHLRQRLDVAVRHHLAGRNALVLLDVGAGDRPYAAMFAPYCRRYVALDYVPRLASTNIAATAERLPLRAASVDIVLSTQVLEHVSNPAAAVAEWRRVLRPGGLVFASTHGTFSFHPDPNDYWRWTHMGLRKLFEDAGFTMHALDACGGNLSTYTALIASDAATRFTRMGLAAPFARVLTLVHQVVERLDPADKVRNLSNDLPGGLPLNYLVIARSPGCGASKCANSEASTTCSRSATRSIIRSTRSGLATSRA